MHSPIYWCRSNFIINSIENWSSPFLWLSMAFLSWQILTIAFIRFKLPLCLCVYVYFKLVHGLKTYQWIVNNSNNRIKMDQINCLRNSLTRIGAKHTLSSYTHSLHTLTFSVWAGERAATTFGLWKSQSTEMPNRNVNSRKCNKRIHWIKSSEQ